MKSLSQRTKHLRNISLVIEYGILKQAFLFICSMLNKRAQTEIDVFLTKLYQTPEEIRQVTSSAFTQCREKISSSAFSSTCWALVHFFTTIITLGNIMD